MARLLFVFFLSVTDKFMEVLDWRRRPVVLPPLLTPLFGTRALEPGYSSPHTVVTCRNASVSMQQKISSDYSGVPS